MNNINLERYYDAIGIRGWNKKTFLNKSSRKMRDCFWKMFAEEKEFHCDYLNAYCKFEESKGRYRMDIVRDDEYKRIDETWNPIKRHKILWWIANIPFNIECWLCCGWKLKYVPADGICKGYWTWIDSYHMLSKLCRVGSPMWPEYKFTWWDKLRFKWITGYKYEEVN